MYLKSIELHGFKSFNERTKLEFRPGISAIVGPNGSGKSNITDAVRWVLGEQSARILRGSKMEDVIFSGTNKRKPLGLAEVSITLDNSDGCLPLEFNEVTVTRRTYRSGEGEYLINNTLCRLKDVHNLFIDTGIGSDGFAIIGQGKVEEILNSKPEERRSFVEETAGIVKYRNRKKEAARKLQETEQNIERIQDIISELSGRLEPLEEQAKKVASFKLLKTEGDSLEISLAIHNMGEIKVKQDSINSQIDDKNNEITQVQAKQAKLEAQVEQKKIHIDHWDEEIGELQRELIRISGDSRRRETEISLNMSRQENMIGQAARWDLELKSLREKTILIDEQIIKEEKRLQDLMKEVKEHRDRVLEWEDIQKEQVDNIRILEEKIESVKTAAFDLAQEITDVKNKINYESQHFRSLISLGDKLKDQEQKYHHYIAELGQKYHDIEEKNQEFQSHISILKAEISSLDDQISGLEEVERKVLEENSSTRETLQSKKSRLNLLQEMQSGYEGYYPGVKAVLLAKQKNHPLCQNILGVLAELIRVPENYRLALETALGGAVQNIITRSDEDAKEAIEFLKKTKSGRATFLPLNTVKKVEGEDLIHKLKDLSGVVGLAADLITCHHEIQPAIDFLLKRVVIVKNMDTAVNAAWKLKHQIRIVTLEGDIVNPGGSLTGGSIQSKKGSVFSRLGEIEALQNQLDYYVQQCHAGEKKLARCREELNCVKAKKDKSMKRLKDFEVNYSGLQKDLFQIQEAQKTANGNLNAIHIDLKKNYLEQDETHKKEEGLKLQLITIEEQFHNLTEDVHTLNRHLKETKESNSKDNEGLTAVKVRLAALDQEESTVKQTLKRLFREKDLFISDINEKEKEKKELEIELESIAKVIKESKQALILLEKNDKETEVVLSSKNHLRDAENQGLIEDEKKVKEIAKKQIVLHQEFNQLEMKKNRLDIEWEKYLERLQDKFQIDYEQAVGQKREITSKRAAAIRISEIEREITSLGPVNPNAVDEFEKVHERYQFLSKQQADLLEARNALFKVIDEMDLIMALKFKETLHQLNKQFNNTFYQLFGGGNAELRMTDADCLLETGIDIVVQPPGKKLQHHNLLSGGEKALTGIALLFAILEVRPSPFCIFDEIEAALDESNVDRFADYLRKYAQKTQFIVVSHRQGTMEAADVLYGVTMEEKGISKAVSVKLVDVDIA